MPCSPPVQPKVSGPKSIIDVRPRRRGFALRGGSVSPVKESNAINWPFLMQCRFGLPPRFGLAGRRRGGGGCVVGDHAPAMLRPQIDVRRDHRSVRTRLACDMDMLVNAVSREHHAVHVMLSAELKAQRLTR